VVKPPSDSRDSTVLLERTAVLAAVDHTLESCARGSGQLFVVEGPAGIGKTSVLAAARSRAAAAGMHVLHARASELERTFSYGVVRQLFEPLLRQADDATRGQLFDGVAVHAAQLFDPDQVDRPAASEDEAFALIHGLYWLALNLGETGPVVVAIDDLQWSDAASLRWLSYIARRLETVSVCALVTLRSGEDEDAALADLLSDPMTVASRPAPLTPSAVTDLIHAGLGADAEEEFCLACHRATGGNPLFVHELVRTLEAEGLPPTADSIEVVERIAPEAVSRSVKARLSRLPAEATSVASAIAVMGDGADGLHVAQLADIDSRALSSAAAALARVHLIHGDEPLRFMHPVVRNAVYESISSGERADAHARAALLLAGARAPSASVAAQLLHAPPGAVDQAAAVLGEAAQQAAAEGSPESTAAYLCRALEESLPGPERADILVALARAELRLGAPTALERVSDALALVDDPQRRSSVQLQLARYQLGWNKEEDATRTLERALAERGVGDDDQSRRIEAELLTAAIHNPDLQATVHARLDSLELDPSNGPGARVLLGVRAYYDATRGTNRGRALAGAERALPDISQYTEEIDWSLAHGRILHVLLLSDDFAAAAPIIEELVVDARRRGGALAFSSASVWRGSLEHATGALIEAEADARLAFDGRPPHVYMETPWLYGLLAQVLVERGAVDEASRILADFETEVDSFREDDRNHAILFRARAHVALTKGHQRAAVTDALAAGRIARWMGFVNPAVDYGLTWRSEAGLAHHFLGEDDAALELALEQLELARAWGAPRTLGQALRIVGVVEGGPEGLERLEEAASVLETSGARLEYGYALTDLGSALRRSNQRTAAREPLRLALELAQRGGAKLLAARAHEELIASGARPRRMFASGVDALTPSERRVSALAAEGLSNREIAQSLFVTLRTVETHLSSAFRKLDVSARTQLAAALASAEQTQVAGRAR
jgi:DNA-binding CsgD family transcriptional regulator